MKYVCEVCGYEYDEELGDPENGIAPGYGCVKITFAEHAFQLDAVNLCTWSLISVLLCG